MLLCHQYFKYLKSHSFLIGVLSAATFFSSCSNPFQSKNAPPIPFEKVGAYSKSEIQRIVEAGNIVVVDEKLEPINGAQILIGKALNDPFQANYLKANASGILPLPVAWTTAEHVTVDAVGYIRQTYLDQSPHGLLFKMKKLVSENNFEVNGLTQGHVIKDKDDILDFGLVLSPLSKEDLITFDISKMISPLSDTISVAGNKVEVPGNVTIPKQKENYIISLTIEKPKYRISFDTAGIKNIFGLRAQFPFKKVIKELSNKKPFYDLINYFTFISATSKSVDVQSPITNSDLNVGESPLTQKVAVHAPAFDNKQVMISALAIESQGKWLPTDVKRFESTQSGGMSTLPEGEAVLVSVLKNKSEFDLSLPGMDRLSAVVQKTNVSSSIDFLPLIKDPQITRSDEAQLFVPDVPTSKVRRLGTYAAIDNLIRTTNAKGEIQTQIKKQWEFFGTDWKEKIQVPLFPSRLSSLQTKDRRLEVMYLGDAGINSKVLTTGTEFIEDATHITRSSVDF